MGAHRKNRTEADFSKQDKDGVNVVTIVRLGLFDWKNFMKEIKEYNRHIMNSRKDSEEWKYD